MLDRTKAPNYISSQDIKIPKVDKKKFKNTTCFNIQAKNTELTKLIISLKSGNWFEHMPANAKLACEFLKSGTEQISINDFNFKLELYGGTFIVKNGPDFNHIEILSIKKNFEKILDLVLKSFTTPKFDKAYFETVKKIIKNKLVLEKQNYPVIAYKKFKELIYGPKHPYGYRLKTEDLQNLSIGNIKKYNKEVLFNEPHVFYCSALDKKYDGTVNDFISSIPFVKNIKELEHKMYNNEKKYHKTIKNAAQTSIVIGKTLPLKSHKDYTDITIFNEILGGYFGSRLMQKIREESGFTYGISSRMINYSHSTLFYISTEVNKKVYKEACKQIYGEIERLQADKVSEEELKSVKEYLKGKILLSLDGPFNAFSHLVALTKNNMSLDFYSSLIKRIDSITQEDIQKIGKKYFPIDELVEVTVG